MNVLLLEPYFGGSHKVFLENLQKNLPCTFHCLTLPARKWKWRMRLAAPLFAEQMQYLPACDVILCSTFVDVAALRGMGPSWLQKARVITYFHENQFAYPVQVNDERDMHFALTNLTTALASDAIVFNSRFNLQTFMEGTGILLKKAPDMDLVHFLEEIGRKATILSPGVVFQDIDDAKPEITVEEPVIIWNHRWEHDKNPDLFFSTLYALDQQEIPFKLVILGQSFSRRPPIFDQARKRLAHRIIHMGRVDRDAYCRWLKSGDLVVSTADHEFFGIAVLEAVRAGCRPLLPKKLSYPELFPDEYLYHVGDFANALKTGLKRGCLSLESALRLTEKHGWDFLAGRYAKVFEKSFRE